jgi:large conductance mechanosensitive channel
MSTLSEFKAFVQRGNVIDLAVAVVIGTAFGKIVTSFVNDVLMPPIGVLVGKVSFADLSARIGGTPEEPVTLNYGAFAQSIIDFLIIAFCVFMIVKAVNAMKKPAAAAAPPGPTPEQQLLTEIRDLLRARS